MKQSKLLHFLVLPLVCFSLMGLGALASAEVNEEDGREQATTNLRGTVNFVHQDGWLLIIDDQSYSVARVVQFNDSAWSREQLFRTLEPGSKIEFDLRATGAPSGTRIIDSITLVDSP